jgi:hypothetical protein
MQNKMNNLKKTLIGSYILGSLCSFSSESIAETCPQDSLMNNVESIELRLDTPNMLEEYPLFDKLFDRGISRYEFNFNEDSYDNDFFIRGNELEKDLNENFKFFIRSENNEVSSGIRIYF